MNKIVFLTFFGMLSQHFYAQELNVDLELRPRFEYRHGYKTLVPDATDAATFVSQRSRLNFNYSMAGDKSIAPKRVYSDGLRTWFDYGSEIDYRYLPAIYAVIDGIDTPINVVREGSQLVAHAHGKFTLKSGYKVTCVYPTESHD